MIVTRKIRQPSRGKASQPYRFGSLGTKGRGENREGKGRKGKKVRSWYKVQKRRGGLPSVRQQHAPVCLAAAQQQQQEDSDASGV